MGKLINHGVFVEWQIYDVITSARQSRILVLAGISWITGYLQHTSRDELSCNKEVCRDQSQPNMLPEQLYFILICSFSFFFLASVMSATFSSQMSRPPRLLVPERRFQSWFCFNTFREPARISTTSRTECDVIFFASRCNRIENNKVFIMDSLC